MLPGRPRIQPSNEPAVPVRSSWAACGALKCASIVSAWLGAVAFNVPLEISSTTGGRPPPSATVRTESRTSMLAIHGKAGLATTRKDLLSTARGPEPSGGGSISRLASPASLRSTRMSAPSSTSRLIFDSPSRSENGSRYIVILRTRASSGRDPQDALDSVTPSAISAGSRLKWTLSGTRAVSWRPVTRRTWSSSRLW